MKTLQDIKTIAIAGAGTMGAGIAQLCAAAGFKTVVYDIKEAAIARGLNIIPKNLDGAIERGKMTADQKAALLDQIKTVSRLEDLKADVIIEAALEKLDIKRALLDRKS